MRKASTTVLLIVSAAVVCRAQSKPDGERDLLRGPVEYVKLERGLISNAGKEVGRRPESIHKYDHLGRLTEEAHFDTGRFIVRPGKDEVKIRTRTMISYGPQSGVREEIITDSDNQVISKTVTRYDTAKGTQDITTQPLKGSATKSICVYDGSGRLIEKRTEGVPQLEGKTVFSYSPEGRLVEESRYLNGDSMVAKTSYRYYPEALRIDRIDFREKDTVEDLVVVIRDFKKRTNEVSYYRANGTLAWKSTYGYDEKGNVIGEEFANLDSLNKYSYQYEIDAAGNWVKRTKLKWFVVPGKSEAAPAPVETQYRTISYYSDPYIASSGDHLEFPRDQYAGGAESVVLGEAIEYAELETPRTMQLMNKSYDLTVEVVVDKEGRVESSRALSGPKALWEAGEKSARRYRFKPALLNGFPVRTTRSVSFGMNIVIQRR